MGLRSDLPIYVTRKTADGYTGSYTLTAWMPLLALFVIWLNVVGWGIYGLVCLAGHIVEAL